MRRAYVTFWGDKRGPNGMPDPYRSYLIFASPWESPDGAIASIFPASGELYPVPPHVPVLQGGERAALDEAIERLKDLPVNRELKHNVDEY